MLIERIDIENFRNIERMSLELRPLTVIVGPNASGKSSILYALLWILLRADNPTLTNPPSPKEKEILSINSYEDLVFRKERGRWFGVHFALKLNEYLKRLLKEQAREIRWECINVHEPSFERVNYGFFLKINQRGELDYRVLLKVDDIEISFTQELDEVKGEYRNEISGPGKLKAIVFPSPVYTYTLFGRLYLTDIFLRGGVTFSTEHKAELDRLEKLLEFLLEKIRSEITGHIFFLASGRGREVPLSLEIKDIEARGVVGFYGEKLLNALLSVYAAASSGIREVLGSELDKWAERFGLKDLTAGLEEKAAKAKYKDPSGVEIDVASAAYGHKQLLPLLTQCIAAPRNSMIMIEEPEISLHPSSQALLPLFFADMIKKYDKQIIITTHSPFLVMAIADAISGSEEFPDVQRLRPQDVVIYEVERDDTGTAKPKEIKLSKEGYPKDGIPSFLKVELNLYNKLLRRLGEGYE